MFAAKGLMDWDDTISGAQHGPLPPEVDGDSSNV